MNLLYYVCITIMRLSEDVILIIRIIYVFSDFTNKVIFSILVAFLDTAYHQFKCCINGGYKL